MLSSFGFKEPIAEIYWHLDARKAAVKIGLDKVASLPGWLLYNYLQPGICVKPPVPSSLALALRLSLQQPGYFKGIAHCPRNAACGGIAGG